MESFCSTERLEEKFVSSWKGRENEDCIWWNGEWWSWNRLNDLALDCEKKLSKAGFKKGQRVAVLLPNSPMVISLAIACWRLGGAIAPLNVRTGVANLLSTIKILDVHCVFVAEDRFDMSVDAGKDTMVPVVAAKLDQPLGQWKGREGIPETEEYAIIFSTSGTSGFPKAVGCFHSNIISNINSPLTHVPGLLDLDSIFLNVLPNFHTFGFNMACIMPLLNGVRQAIIPNFVPVDNTINAIKDAGVNCIIAVPTIMAFLLSALAKKEEHLDGIKFAITGGDKLNVRMVERCEQYMGVGILEGYGLTECSPVVAVGHCADKARLGTVGQIYDTYEVQIRDRDGKTLGLQEEGVLWVKGPSVVKGYFRDEVNTKERFSDGWFNTGDVVKIDDDGYVKIVDRASDIIIVSGFNVYPQEVELVLCQHPAVQEAVAVSEKNSITGELVKAFIILREGVQVTQKELMDYCKEHLAHYKVPRKIGFVSEYPISPAGKILRRELRKIKIER